MGKNFIGGTDETELIFSPCLKYIVKTSLEDTAETSHSHLGL